MLSFLCHVFLLLLSLHSRDEDVEPSHRIAHDVDDPVAKALAPRGVICRSWPFLQLMQRRGPSPRGGEAHPPNATEDTPLRSLTAILGKNPTEPAVVLYFPSEPSVPRAEPPFTRASNPSTAFPNFRLGLLPDRKTPSRRNGQIFEKPARFLETNATL